MTMSTIQQEARAVLGLPTRKRITKRMVQQAWSVAVRKHHPDTNPGVDPSLIKSVNVSRDVLLRVISEGETGTAPTAPRSKSRRSNTLLITPEGHLFGQGDLYLGNAGTVAFAIAYCGRAGWKYELCNQLSESQQRALDNRPKPKRRRR